MKKNYSKNNVLKVCIRLVLGTLVALCVKNYRSFCVNKSEQNTLGYASDSRLSSTDELRKFSKLLLSQLPRLSLSQENKVKDWLLQHQAIIDHLKEMSIQKKNDWESIKIEKNKELKEAGIDLYKSHANFVGKIPGTHLIVKLPGDINKFWNLAIYEGWDKELYNRTLTDQQYFTIFNESKLIPTFQGISRAVRYLVVRDALQKGELRGVRLPETYLVPYINARDLTLVDDWNYCVVEEEISPKNLTFFDEKNLKAFEALSFEQLNNLLDFIKISYAWSLSNNIGIDEHGILVAFDLETRNSNQAAEAWLKDPAQGQFTAMLVGFKTVLEWSIILKDTAKINQIIEYVQKLPQSIKNHYYYKEGLQAIITTAQHTIYQIKEQI